MQNLRHSSRSRFAGLGRVIFLLFTLVLLFLCCCFVLFFEFLNCIFRNSIFSADLDCRNLFVPNPKPYCVKRNSVILRDFLASIQFPHKIPPFFVYLNTCNYFHLVI
nr:MAG TPA: hypothetical protein [Caudoviricetes sp.]